MHRELLQDSDGVNESFWGGLGVEIEPCANFKHFAALPGPAR